ncbi:Rho termination factor N-terminal domain-containing protein [Bacillus paranthracis]|uniref:Rho termination factor N-terminal domain-containing protein n=1 Tax=Bacillus TaxID=1386 RepID=UPI000CCC0628|nr:MULTISPECIES: Rho termination factor N-terminal domain-containing protein [Bacillus]MDO3374571.1 Rho termination factor N-terminal domain-containing protein [Bacillus paranthracis]PNS32758.1 hypothetical protein C1640_09540 [Bacillus sp. AKBS9]
MIFEVRKTISGTEYWDSTKQKSLFVPNGEEPGFEVSGTLSAGLHESAELITDMAINLDDMTVKELREYAASINVEIPSDMKKKEDIIELLS